ncbi:MAG: divergent polysaccharide deacetylase family protein [Gammaproteobacteria bacterium]|nr:divergent polysaccharide deacetylase family protein [Gammaproteobacteria bacterium]
MIRTRLQIFRWLLLIGLFCSSAAQAATPAIAIIIDDLGYRYAEGKRAVALPGPIACAIIPNTPHSGIMAQAAHAFGKEVLLHLPMQPLDPERPVGDDGIALDTTRIGVAAALRKGIDSVPHVIGVNNHMGSLITRHPGHMTWLMQDLHDRELFFIDSVTTESSVALKMAREQGVLSARRDVFIDREDATPQEIFDQLKRLYKRAHRNGHALGIAHPYPATMTVLERELPRLSEHGVRLVSVSDFVQLANHKTVASVEIALAEQHTH